MSDKKFNNVDGVYKGNIIDIIKTNNPANNTLVIKDGSFLLNPIEISLENGGDGYLTTTNGFIHGITSIGNKKGYKVSIEGDNPDNPVTVERSGTIETIKNGAELKIKDTSNGSLVVQNWKISLGNDGSLLFTPIQ